jgi:tetratricopeptide (TPR) repeat protein
MILLNKAALRLLVAWVLAVLLVPSYAPAAAADDTLADVERQLDRVDDLFDSGSDELASSMLDTAVETLEAAAKRDPKSAKAQALLARAYAGRGDAELADAASTRAAELEPANAEYQFLHGLALARAEKPEAALAAFRRATELDPGHAKSALMVGVVSADAGDEDAALEWFVKAATIDPKYATAHGNVGQIYQNRGKSADALAAFQKAVEAAPEDWRFRAKLVQLYQALGKTEERDHERAVIRDLWDEDKVDQPHFCREQFEVAGKKVQAYEHFELAGDRPVRYAFLVLKPDGQRPDFKITLGSYEMTTRIARERGTIGKDERMFHLDGYYADGSHRTFGMFRKEPSYEETRVRVVEVLKGKLKAKSSSTPGREGGIDVKVEVEADPDAPVEKE